MGTIQVIRQNLVANPRATVNTTGWIATFFFDDATSTETLVRSTAQGRSSNTSFAVTPITTGSDAYLKTAKMPYSFDSWSLSAYFKVTGGTWYGIMHQQYYNAGGTYLGAQSSAASFGSSSAWTRVALNTGPAPYPTATQCEFAISVHASHPTPHVEFFVTDCLMEQGSTTKAFFDGDSADTFSTYATLNTGWFGTANASSSFAEFGIASAQNLGSVLDGPDVLGF